MELAPPSLAAPLRTQSARYMPWNRSQAVRAVVCACVVGLTIDQVVHTHIVGLAGCLMVLVAAAGMLVSRPIKRSRVLWVTLAVSLTPWLALRTSPWLVAPTLIAIVVLFTLAAAPDDTSLVSFPGLARRGAAVLEAAVECPREVVRAASTLTPVDAEQQLRRSLRGMAIAASIGLLLLVLLVSGDAYFASFIGVPTLGMRLFDAFVVVTGGMVWLSLIVVGRRPTAPRRTFGRPATLGSREVAFLLGTIVLVLGGYVSSLIAGALGGARYIQRTTGLTYAEYARSGFFQLVAVVAIVGTVLISCRTIIATSPHRRRLLLAALVICTLTIVMVAVSIVRLQTYRQVFGLTMLRLSTTVFAVWLGAVIVLIGLSLIKAGLGRLLVIAVVLSAYGALVVTSWLDPEAMVARENIDRIDWSSGATASAGGARFDSDYLATNLSDDAVPALVERLDVLPADQRTALVELLCDRRTVDDGWSWNRARARADELLTELCS